MTTPAFVCYAPRPVLPPLDAAVLATLRDARGFYRSGLTVRDIRARVAGHDCARCLEQSVGASLVALAVARLSRAKRITRGQSGWRVA